MTRSVKSADQFVIDSNSVPWRIFDRKRVSTHRSATHSMRSPAVWLCLVTFSRTLFDFPDLCRFIFFATLSAATVLLLLWCGQPTITAVYSFNTHSYTRSYRTRLVPVSILDTSMSCDVMYHVMLVISCRQQTWNRVTGSSGYSGQPHYRLLWNCWLVEVNSSIMKNDTYLFQTLLCKCWLSRGYKSVAQFSWFDY